MTTTQKVLVQATFARVEPIADQAAELFYGRLFELDPSLRPMFHTDLKEQGKKLMQMLAVVVHGLDRFETVQPQVEDLGHRHVDYGVTSEHYNTVGAALLWTLEQGLGDGFTDDVREAWTAAYGTLANVMQAGARRHDRSRMGHAVEA